MDKVSASQPRDHGYEPHTGHGYDFPSDTWTGWFQGADSRVINMSCKNLFQNRAKINMLKLYTYKNNLKPSKSKTNAYIYDLVLLLSMLTKYVITYLQ